MKLVTKRDGKKFSEQICTAAEGARTLHVKTTNYSIEADKPLIREAEWERIGEPVSAANTISGSWRMQKLNVPENELFALSITGVLQVRSAFDARARIARDRLQILVDRSEIVVSHVLEGRPWHDLQKIAVKRSH